MRSRGFTLVELLCVVAIVALLSGIAWPGYRQMLIRAHRAEARLALLRVQAQQERHHLAYHRYGSDLTAPSSADALGLADLATLAHYSVTLRLRQEGRGYVATATPRLRSMQAGDVECGALWVDETGLRGATGSATGAAACWP